MGEKSIEGEMGDAIFTLTKRFTTSVGLINKIPTAKLGLVLERVVSNIDSGDAPFSEDENKKLCALFSLSEEEMASVLDALCFIFEQLAYHEVTSDQLTAHLSKTGITSDRVTCFVTIWTNQKKELLSKLRVKTVVPKTVDRVDWRLQLAMAQNDLSSISKPTSIFSFSLKDQDKKETDALSIEFSHEELLSFYDKIEVIQSQLDALS